VFSGERRILPRKRDEKVRENVGVWIEKFWRFDISNEMMKWRWGNGGGH
jgi:hypothetical protein